MQISFNVDHTLDADDIAQALSGRDPEDLEAFARELVNALDEYAGIVAASYFANGASDAQVKLAQEAVGGIPQSADTTKERAE